MVAVNEDDLTLLNQIISDSTYTNCLDDLINGITYMGISDIQEPPIKDINGLLFIEIPATVTVYANNIGTEKKKVHFVLRRDSMKDRWFIDAYSLYEGLRWREINNVEKNH